MSTRRDALLVLDDGTEFEGEAIGALRQDATGVATGECVFNTALSGYQEIVTDPSYAGQVITFTYPHIGNYGVNADDDESRRPVLRRGGRARPRHATTATGGAETSLDDLLVRHGVPGITGIDTRRLTRHLRDAGALPGAFGTDEAAVRAAAARRARGTDGIDLVAERHHREPYVVGDDDAPFRVVAYDFGIKRTILRHLVGVGLPGRGRSGVDDRGRRPRPRARTVSSSRTVPAIPPRSPARSTRSRALVGEVPVFGICLGHQILGLALGGRHLQAARSATTAATTRSATRPTGRVEITSQNHNYAVAGRRARRAASSSPT